MSLKQLKKAELQALAEANDVLFDPDWTKAELAEELDSAGITADDNSDVKEKGESKIARQARLQAR